MTKKHLVATIAVALAVGAGGFFGGMKYGQSKTPAQGRLTMQNFQNLTPEQRQQSLQQFQGNGGAPGAGGQRVINGPDAAGFVNGEIISKDSQSITVKLRDGGSRIVFLSGSTSIGKMASGTPDDLSAGKQITVSGTANSDGSVSAQTIQLRP